jgi:hypothetical protein
MSVPVAAQHPTARRRARVPEGLTMENCVFDLLRELIVGIISGVVSAPLFFLLLSRREPKISIIASEDDDRIRINVKNIRQPRFLPPFVCSVVENIAELHIVISTKSEDPLSSERIPLVRNDPLIIKPQATFVFVTKDSTACIRARVEAAEGRWREAGRNVNNVGLRFRLLSRDGFSNVPKSFECTWRSRGLAVDSDNLP